MGTAILHLNPLRQPWRGLWRKLSPRSSSRGCVHIRALWDSVLFGRPAILFGGVRYCLDRCLAPAVADFLGKLENAPATSPKPHRIPLGLLMLSRQQLTAEQLQIALEAQRSAGRGRIGEWLQELGLADEGQITAALACQWSCPVLRMGSFWSPGVRLPQLPFALLSTFATIPVQYVEHSATLYMAFCERVDYGVLYAIEQMTGCRATACMATPSLVHSQLQRLADLRSKNEIILEQPIEAAESCRLVASYCARLSASELRIALCGPYLWIRLFKSARCAFDLLLRAPHRSSSSSQCQKTAF